MRVLKNYIYNLSYQVLLIIIPIITVPYVSRILGASNIGINSYTNSVVQYFVLATNIGINLYGNRAIAYFRDDLKKRSQIFFEISILKLIFMLFSFITFLLIFKNQSDSSFFLAQSPFILAAGIDISWYFMGMEDFKKIIFRNFIIKTISVFMIFILVKSQDDLIVYILCLSLSQFLGNLSLIAYLKGDVKLIEISIKSIYAHLRSSLGLFLPQVAVQIVMVLNKTILGQTTTFVEVGYFDNADKLIRIVLSIITSLSTVMMPRISSIFSKGDLYLVEKYTYNSFQISNMIGFGLCFGLAGIASNISVLFFGSGFKGIEFLISILAIELIFMSWNNVTGGQFLVPTNRVNLYTKSVIIAAVISIFLGVVIVPKYNSFGAVINSVFSEATIAVVQLVFLRKVLNLKKLLQGTSTYLLSGICMFVFLRIFDKIECHIFVKLFFQIFLGGSIYIVLIFSMKVPIAKKVYILLKEKYFNK